MITPITARNDKDSRVDVDTTSGGKALAFVNGKLTQGTWKKSDNRTKFYDGSGAEIVFEPGNTWISVVQEASRVIYK